MEKYHNEILDTLYFLELSRVTLYMSDAVTEINGEIFYFWFRNFRVLSETKIISSKISDWQR